MLTCGPVQTSFQVDIEIYEDKLGQSGDRILSSHITNMSIASLEYIHKYMISLYENDLFSKIKMQIHV